MAAVTGAAERGTADILRTDLLSCGCRPTGGLPHHVAVSLSLRLEGY